MFHGSGTDADPVVVPDPIRVSAREKAHSKQAGVRGVQASAAAGQLQVTVVLPAVRQARRK